MKRIDVNAKLALIGEEIHKAFMDEEFENMSDLIDEFIMLERDWRKINE